jgi:galactokinase
MMESGSDISLRAAVERHRAAFGARTAAVRRVFAPYRICPLGAHVDHQLGVVTGLALDAGIELAFTANPDRTVRLRSLDFDGEVEFDLDAVPGFRAGDWGNYARGAARALGAAHPLRRGIDGVLAGSLPIGGLSSSAAAGVAYLLAIEAANDLSLSHQENIRLDRDIENGYVGLNNGVLDQSVILLGRRNSLIHLDCATGAHEAVPLAGGAPGLEIAVVYSGLSRALTGTEYNRRVEECVEAARLLLGPGAGARPVLRDVPRETFVERGAQLPERLRRRARHFFEECDRVPRGVEAWRRGDLAAVGRLMTESGASSIRNYESGAPHLVSLYEILAATPGVHGTRFSGGGFRGSCVALVEPGRRGEIEAAVRAHYPERHPDVAELYSVHFCGTGEGARLR